MLQLKVYIVEDDPLMASSILHMISTIGHEVSGMATSYENAILDLSNLQVDLIITDIMLDGSKTGIDLAKHIKSKLPTIPFIFQSSVTDKNLIQQALDTGPVAFLVKPLNKSALLNAISSIPQK